MKVRGNTTEIAKKLGVEYLVAHSLLTFLEQRGLAKIVEKVKSPSGRGKPTNIWEFENELTIKLVQE